LEFEMMPNDESVKPWRCPKCHAALGRVERDGDGIRRLKVFQRAVPAELPAGDEVIKVTVRGGSLDVYCELCGAVRTWVPGEEGLRELLKRCG
jgi:hypothetical protein